MMPLYAYECECGKRPEKFHAFPAPDRVKCECGKQARRTFACGISVWKEPMECWALAIHPDQVPEAMQKARERGVPTEFSSRACPLFHDRGHKNDYLKAFGYMDRDAGYSDASPGDSLRSKGM